MSVVTTETTVATYAAPNGNGEFGVDLIIHDVERDEDGAVLAREEAGWGWTPAAAVIWDTDKADELLAAMGWKRTEAWNYVADLAGSAGWTAAVARAAAPSGI